MRIKEREKVEEAECLRYRSQLDDKADKRSANKREFYKDLSRMQVSHFRRESFIASDK